jgi:hypothetical protein
MGQISKEQQDTIVSRIRSGSFPHVAAASVGVPREVFDEWMKQGRAQRRGRRRQFWLQVCQAQAEIRARMEIEVKQDPKFWLRFGPGKQGGSVHGWGPVGKRRPRKPRQETDWQPALFALLGEIARKLQPMPDARQVILDAIDRISSPRPSGERGPG